MNRTIRIKVIAVGQNHAFVARLRALNNRTIESTDAYPFREAAEQAARDLAAKRGWDVA